MSLFENTSNIWVNGNSGSSAYLNGTLIWSASIVNQSVLYEFTSFTFTNVNTSGRTGPTIQNLRGAYSGSASWASNNAYFSTASAGIQLWTVPESATYEIEVAGAGGAPNESTAGGKGVIIKGRVSLTQGEKIQILVGQTGSVASGRLYRSSAGGGGSFVVKYTGVTNVVADILIVAGGGAGAGSSPVDAQANGQTTTSGGQARASNINQGGAGGTNGSGGATGNASSNGPGGGFLTNGSTSNGAEGRSFISGGLGGNVNSTYAPQGGGFGGGGAPNNGDLNRFAGGGGFSGGGASNTLGSTAQSNAGGGGGGSYIQSGITDISTSNGLYAASSSFSGSNITNLNKYNSGSGYVTITKL